MGPSAAAVALPMPIGGPHADASFGDPLDLRGGLPFLPSPAPGLIGSGINFVGHIPDSAETQVEAAAARVEPDAQSAPARRGRAASAGQTPSLPGQAASGASSLAILLSRDDVDSSSIENGKSEKAVAHGRGYFDLSRDKDRAALSAASERSLPDGAGAVLKGGTHDAGRVDLGRSAPSKAGAPIVGRGASRVTVLEASEAETLHDAVASAPGAAAFAPGAVARGADASARAYAAPNGELMGSPGASGTAVPAFPAVPNPLILDRSVSGLIVRVRSALSGAFASPAAIPARHNVAAPRPSTALLERGAMLEAFSVADAHADGADIRSPFASLTSARGPRLAPPSPISGSAPMPLWWAWLIAPLFVGAVRVLRS
jgi:hypothetical protein